MILRFLEADKATLGACSRQRVNFVSPPCYTLAATSRSMLSGALRNAPSWLQGERSNTTAPLTSG